MLTYSNGQCCVVVTNVEKAFWYKHIELENHELMGVDFANLDYTIR